jgi:putative AlgH/UPF0301 family transcriptional regulator
MIRALCASLLLFAMSWAASADNAKPLTTILLVAQAELRDPKFKGSVVLVMNNIGPAPAGIIINRPTSILEAETARGDWTLAPAEASAIFDGKSERPWPERQTPDAAHRT